MAAEEADYFAAAGGVPDEHGVFDVQVLEDGEQVIRVSVHVVSAPGLAGASVAATVMGDDAVAVLS